MKTRKVLRLLFSLIATAFFAWLIARQINLDELVQALFGATKSLIAAALVAFAAGYACRIERWRLMLKRDNCNLKWQQCAGPLLASFAANNVLPFRAGDVLRAFAFNDRLGVSSGVVVATLFVERLLDLLMVLLLLGVALNLFGLDGNKLAGIGSAALAALAIGIVLILSAPRLFGPIVIRVGKLVARAAPKLGERLLGEMDQGLTTLVRLTTGGTMFSLVTWSVAAWLAEGCVFWFAALALSSITNPAAGWLALPIGTLATLIPSTPGYVGTFDYFTVRAMSTLGNGSVASTAYALLVHALLWLPPTLMGALYLLIHPAKKAKQAQVIE